MNPFTQSATAFEFRSRIFLISALFTVSFWLYALDSQNMGHWLATQVGFGHSTAAHHAIFGFGALLCWLAALVRVWATGYLGPEVMMDSRLHDDRLVADGPYRHLRNPLYFGNFLLAFGMGLACSRAGFALLIVGHFFIFLRLIRREEQELLASQVKGYAAYLRAVPRLWPSFAPRLPKGSGRFSLIGGALGEIYFLGFAASLMIFACTLRLHDYYIALAATSVAFLISAVLVRRRANNRGQ